MLFYNAMRLGMAYQDAWIHENRGAGAKMIVYAWVNDDDAKRAFESSDDAYRTFRKRLESGQPPNDWDQLLSQAELAGHRQRQAFNTLSE